MKILTVLRRWLSGEGRASDERALDAAVRDDPFVAEAMEGYRAFADADHEARLETLRSRLKERTAQKRRGVVYLLPRAVAIAASVLMLAGMGWWLSRESNEDQLLSKNETQSAPVPVDTGSDQAIAQLEQQAPAATDEPDAAPSTTLYSYNSRSRKLNVVPIMPSQGMAQNEFDDALTENKAALADAAPAKPEAIEKAADAFTKIVPAESESGVAYQPAPKNAAPATPGNRAREDAKKDMAVDAAKTAKEKQRLNNLSNINGRVTDVNGEPLIGATILVEGTNRGVSTDMDGNFNLPLSGGEERLVINYTGYAPIIAPIKAHGPMNVTLQENAMALDEVTVSSYSKKKSEAQAYKITPSAAPAVGAEAYQTYLSQNLRYPAAARDKSIQGVVRLRFTVNKNGKLSNFKVVQPLGYGCDEEAIRLIKDGPDWKISGDARKVQVDWEIRF